MNGPRSTVPASTLPASTLLAATLLAATLLFLGGCGGEGRTPDADAPAAGEGEAAAGSVAFTGARIWDGTGADPIADGTLVVREGRVAAVGPAGEVEVPAGARIVDLDGHTVVPGLVNAHGHVGMARGLETGPDVYTRDNVLDQLRLSARYGVTTVVSLGGGGPEGVGVREDEGPGLTRARLRLAGPVLDPSTTEEARSRVADLAEMDVDWVKIRVDDFLDTAEKMPPDVYGAVADAAAERGLPLAVHIVELADAKAVVRAGADLVAHSVRDRPVDRELIELMKERDVCLSPTLAREVSTFVYARRPDFFDDPFFRREADPEVLETLTDSARMARVRASESAEYYREALPVAQENVKRLADAGVGIAFGTDSGPPARFQGYFEHMETELMAEAGLSPERILRAATGEAARCMGLEGAVGTLVPGARADFLVLRRDPLTDVRNLRTLESVRIAGNQVPGGRWDPSETGVEGPGSTP